MYPVVGTGNSFSWPEGSSKVDTVCDQMRESMGDSSEGRLIVISCLVKSSRSDVASALVKIEQIRGN